MLTTVPVNVFKELLKKSVDETIFSDTDPFLPLSDTEDPKNLGKPHHFVSNASKKPFSWSDMTKFSKTYGDILYYLEGKVNNVHSVGEGSARVAFMLGEGSTDSSGKSVPPACLKVAKNERGIAQNDAEISMFTKYKFDCFPKLYDYDTSNKYYILTEIGTSFYDPNIDEIFTTKKYFKEWNREVRDDPMLQSAEMDMIFDAADDFMAMVTHFGNAKYFTPNELDAIYKFAEKMASKYKKYEPFFSMLDFCKVYGERMRFGDFAREANWGVVIRDGEAVPIPIDFGFTKEVAEKYY